MSETVTNKAYPWISFETSPGYARPKSQVRRCARCGAEETVKPLTGSQGSRYFPGTVTWIEAHFRCKEPSCPDPAGVALSGLIAASGFPCGKAEGPEEYPDG